ncbi:hypothetical protein PI125_g13539 [Phytophthora idaei]|nr:hypothetical protein PI125_g13539 [Phytophthora idaei]
MPKAWKKTKPAKKRRAAPARLLSLRRIAPHSRRQVHGFGIRRYLLLVPQ